MEINESEHHDDNWHDQQLKQSNKNIWIIAELDHCKKCRRMKQCTMNVQCTTALTVLQPRGIVLIESTKIRWFSEQSDRETGPHERWPKTLKN